MNRNAGRIAVAMLLGLAGGSAGAVDAGVEQAAAGVDAQVLAWRRDLHQHPELSNRETRTAALVAKQLRALGFEVKERVGKTGVVAYLQGGKPGPTVAVRADMDALPVTEEVDLPFKSTVRAQYAGQDVGVMHACGHDGHTSVLLGVATALSGMRKELAGNVLFVFQPAEEGPPGDEEGGAALMLKEGAFAGHPPAAVFGLHVWASLNTGTLGVRAGPTMAGSDQFRIVVKGAQTHGAKPWSGIDPVVAAANVVTSLQTIVSRRLDLTKAPAVVSVGRINGGVRYNIIPEQVELVGTIRTFDLGMRDTIWKAMAATASAAAATTGATATTEIKSNAGMLSNDRALTERMRPSLVKAAGADHVVEMPYVMPAEDFAAFADQVPGMYFFVGVTPAGENAEAAAFNHSPRFRLDEKALPLATRAMLQVVVDFLK